MDTVLFVLLIALPPVVLVLLVVRQTLFYVVVAPAAKERGPRYWLNTLVGPNQATQTKSYLAGLPPEQRGRWPNWYLRYSGYIIWACIVLWWLLLFAAR